MLDPSYIRDHIDEVRAGLRSRGLEPDKVLEEIATLETARRRMIPELESLKRAQNTSGDEIARAKRMGQDTGPVQEANRARAQIRRPLGSAAQVTISVVGSNGDVLGLVRTPDAPVFGADVSLQKARTALLFSQTSAAADLSALPDAVYISPAVNSPIGVYVAGMQAFFADPSTLANGVAYSARAVGNIARPVFPDGINGSLVAGPLSKPPVNWSPFNAGLQLDLVYNKLIAATAADLSVGCTGLPQAKNGIQIFPGAVPIYRGAQLIGAIGVSGDGTDQDDMVAFLGLARAGVAVGNASAAMRADTLVPPASPGDHLRYVQCPVAPFNPPFDSESNVCAGF